MGGSRTALWGVGGSHYGTAEHYELTNTATMAEVLRALRRKRPSGTLQDLAGQSHAARVLGLAEGVNELRLFFESQPTKGPAAFRFSLQEVVFVMLGDLRCDDGGFTLRGPIRLFSLDRRRVTRWRLPPGRAELQWHSGGGDSEAPLRSEVRDLTPDGVGVSLPPNAGPLPKGTFPALLRVGDTSVPCLARTARTPSGPGDLYGISLRTGPLGDAMIETYLRERLPRLGPRRDKPAEIVAALMHESGYLALREGGAVLHEWHSLELPDTESYDRVYTAADGTVLGHVSVTRVYERTWLLHQLACLGGHSESGEARINLYMLGGTAPTLRDGDAAHALAYFDQKKRWHQLFFQRFVDWVGDPRCTTIYSFDRLEREESAEPFDAPAECHVTTLRDEELVEVCGMVRAQLPESIADAMDIHPVLLRQPAATIDGRGREVLVLWERGVRAGVALCETGHPSLSLFNILNSAQIYLNPGATAPSLVGQRTLMAACRRFYAARGVKRPLLVAPPGTLQPEAEPGTVLAERMGCFHVDGRGLRQWENFCRFHFGERWRRRQTQRGQ